MRIDLDYSIARVAANGCMGPEEAVELATSALGTAQSEGASSLILNLKDVTLVRTLSITECHDAGQQLARAGRALGKVAVVTRPECMEPHQFIFTVARNRGLQVATFANESEAVGWLQS